MYVSTAGPTDLVSPGAILGHLLRSAEQSQDFPQSPAGEAAVGGLRKLRELVKIFEVPLRGMKLWISTF